MGDESPEQTEMVCTACGEMFSREREFENPFDEVECPHCGASTAVGDPTDPSAPVPGSEEGFADAEAETALVESPGAEEGASIEEEDTAKDQKSLERARRESEEHSEQSLEDDSPPEEAARTVEAGLDEISNGEFSSLEELREASSDPDFDGGGPEEDDGSGESGEQPEFEPPDVEMTEDGAGTGGFEEQEVHERETAVSQTPLSERSDVEGVLDPDDAPDKTPAVGMDRVAEHYSEVGEASVDDTSSGEESDAEKSRQSDQAPTVDRDEESGPETTPTSGLDKAIEDTIPPELGEETEAAIDEAVEKSLESESSPPEASDSDHDLEETSVPSPEEALSPEAVSPDEEATGGPPPIPDASDDPQDEEEQEEEASQAPLSAEELLTEDDASEAEARDDAPSDPEQVPVGEGGAEPEPSEQTGPEEGDRRESSERADARDTTREEDDGDGEGAQRQAPDPESSSVSEEPSDSEKRRASSRSAADGTQELDGGSRGLVYAGVAILFVAAAVLLFNPGGLLPESVAIFSSNTTEAGTAKPSAQGSGRPELDRAIRAAREELYGATEIDPSDPELQRDVARRLAEAEEFAAASRVYGALWRERRDDAELGKTYVGMLIRGDRRTRARRVAIEAIQATDQDETFREKFRSSLEDDPRLQSYEPVTLGNRSGLQVIRPADDRDGDGFVLEGLDGTPKFLFAPARTDQPEWRDDVAAWRLCEIIDCGFDIPRTRPARLSRAEFEKRLEADGAEPSEVLTDFQWVEEEGLDGSERKFVYGSLRDWPGEVTRWPIEATDVWRDWLSVYSDPSALDAPLKEALSELKNVGDGSFYRSVLEASNGATTRSTAAGLSRIISFDFLTNNWGRFAEDVEAYGSRNHYAAGRFVTMRTDTAFQRRASTRVKGRFRWISRFSRDFVDSVRLLERDQISPILYPDPAWYEESKLEIFWKQRERLLERVDSLSDERGRDDVLVFE